jgi:hypothetical protein
VSAKHVGFMVYDLRSFSCAQFKCYFHLSGYGGPNWTKEFALWQKVCAKDWVISPGKKRAEQALSASKKKLPRPIFKHTQSSELAKKKLVFAENISYSACYGYSTPGVTLPKNVEANSSTSLIFALLIILHGLPPMYNYLRYQLLLLLPLPVKCMILLLLVMKVLSK